MPEIGATLREARMRARIDVSEIEAQTKIRAKYLRALENEEWDLLPGPTFVKSFLRTYGQALGLDGRALVEEYKLQYEQGGEGDSNRGEIDRQPVASSPRRAPRRTRAGAGSSIRGGGSNTAREGPSRAYMATVGVIGLVIVVLVYALLSGGSSPNSNLNPPASSAGRTGKAPGGTHPRTDKAIRSAGAPLASVRLEPQGEIYVCLMGDGRKRIPGLILTPTTTVHTYHAHRFELTLGNNAVNLTINGKPLTVAPSSQSIGYAITSTGVRTLAPTEQPTCK
jgi:cytoskeleton protein RodZ